MSEQNKSAKAKEQEQADRERAERPVNPADPGPPNYAPEASPSAKEAVATPSPGGVAHATVPLNAIDADGETAAQRKAAAKAKNEPDSEKLVEVRKDGDTLKVHPSTVDSHVAAGWHVAPEKD